MKFKRFTLIFLLVFSVISWNSYSEDMENDNLKKEDSFKYFEAYDPLEPLNRRIYYFNSQFDRYIFLPTVRFYRAVTPELLRKGVHNFFDNTNNISRAGNSLLQFKIAKAMRAIGRFTMNVAFGFGGTVDVASDMGMPRPYEDFGLTLARYGVPKGPYLVLPILGPSSLRDAVGVGVDALSRRAIFDGADLEKLNNAGVVAMHGIEKREGVSFEYYETGSPFEYEYVRFLYFKYRKLQKELGSEVF